MQPNTVIDNTESIAIVEEIRMQHNTDTGCEKTIVVVEGSDDQKLFMHLFNNDKVEYQITNNCLKVIETLTIIQDDKTLKQFVIGIKDADFDHLKGINYELDNLFLTDSHDGETMIINTETFRHVCIETIGAFHDSLLSSAIEYIKVY